jgi:AraC-like DNA-binding protein
MSKKTEQFNFFPFTARAVIYILILLIVLIGHYFLMKISFDLFNELNSTLRPMLTYFCLSGALLLFIRSKTNGGRAQSFYALLMFVCGLIGVVSLIKGFKSGSTVVFEYKYLSTTLLVYGSTYAYIFLLYPIEVLRPGWLTFRRAVILLLPAVVLVTICSLVSYSWLRSLVLIYPIFGIFLLLRYRKNYEQYCINNYAVLKDINISWLDDYLFGYFIITVSYIFVMLSNEPRTGLMHRIIFLLFFLYGFYRVIFQKNPYPENYFKAGLDEVKAEKREITTISNDNQQENDFKVETDSEIRSHFSEKLTEYKEKLEQWMMSEKPYLRKDFKLTDVMDVLPLNRTYLSRLFNEGYGETFYQFVMRYRIAESKQLLLSRPDLSITVISEISGFSSSSVFSRAFAQEINCSPKHWRENEQLNLQQSSHN